MKERSRYLVPMGYISFFILIFLTSLYFSLPYDSIEKRLSYEIESKTPYSVKSESTKVTPLGIKMRGVEISRDGKEILNIGELSISPAFFSLFRTNKRLPFEAMLYGGSISGSFTYSSKIRSFVEAKGELKDIKLESLNSSSNLKAEKMSEWVSGLLSGNLLLNFAPQLSGNFTLGIDDLSLESLKFIRLLNLGDLEKFRCDIKGEILSGKRIKIEDLKLVGKDVELGLWGDLFPAKKLTSSRVDLGVRLSAKGKARKGLSVLTASLLAEPDGSYVGKITGSLGNPRILKKKPK